MVHVVVVTVGVVGVFVWVLWCDMRVVCCVVVWVCVWVVFIAVVLGMWCSVLFLYQIEERFVMPAEDVSVVQCFFLVIVFCGTTPQPGLPGQHTARLDIL